MTTKPPIALPYQVEPASIDPRVRPIVYNDDGSYSTVYSYSFPDDNGSGNQVLVPGVIRDKTGRYYVSKDPKEVWAEYKRTGEHLGKFSKIDPKRDPGQLLHEGLAKEYQNDYGDINRFRPSTMNPAFLSQGQLMAPDIGTTEGYGPDHKLIASSPHPITRTKAAPMAKAKPNLDFHQMMAVANALQTAQPPQAPQAAPDGNTPLMSSTLLPFQLPDNRVEPTPYQTYDHSAAIAGLPGAPARKTMSAEQLRAAVAPLVNKAVVPFAAPDATAGVAPQDAASGATDGTTDSTEAPPPPPLNSPQQMPASGAAGGLAMPSLRTMAANEYNSAAGGINYATKGAKDSLGTMDQGFSEEIGANKQQNELQRKIDTEQNAIDAGATAKAKQQEDDMAAIVRRGEIAANMQMKRVQMAAADAAGAEVHNFWANKSTGARILGILSQAMAGAANGLAGNPSGPTPLDRVIERDMQEQLANIQQKNRNVESQRGVLRDIYEQTGSSLHATTAMYLAAWDRVSKQSSQLKTKFANEKATAADAKMQAIVKERQGELMNKAYNEYRAQDIQRQQHAMNITGEADRTDAMLAAQGVDAKQRYHLAGTTGDVDAQTYSMFKDADEGYRTVVAQAEEIKHIVAEYNAGKLTWADALQKYNSARSYLVTAQRKVQGTGAALSAQEWDNLVKVLPELTKGIIPYFSAHFQADLPNQIDNITGTASRHFYAHIGNTIKGVGLDPHDPVYGYHVTNYLKHVAAQQAERTAAHTGAQ